MDNLDIFYRAFQDYKNRTFDNIDNVRFKKACSALNKKDQEDMVAIFATCTIEEDWVEAIENAIPYIFKAIKEERQFIRNDGEVLPIEKIRTTSKESIADLAKHSNYISHEPNADMNADIVPDKLLMARKENDYTVYENRVVYATLIYLEQFVASRLNKIKDITNKYESEVTLNKNIIVGNHELTYSFKMNDVIKYDPLASKRNKFKDLINRIDNVYSNIVTLLRTPLMIEVSKVDRVNRPITKTNVLKMNRNFKETLKVFDFIAEYDKDGYQINIQKKSFYPFSKDISSDYGDIIMLSSFITYMHSNDIQKELKERYEQKLLEEKKAEEQRIIDRANKLKLNAKLSEKSINEYLIILDQARKLLEEKNLNLEKKIVEQQKEFEKNIEILNAAHAKEITLINEQNAAQIAKIEEGHKKEIEDINVAHQAEIEEINNKQNELNEAHEKELEELNTKHSEEVDALTAEIAEKVNYVASKEKELADKETKLLSDTKNQVDSANKEKDDYKAELLALRLKNNSKVDLNDFTSEERFKELEKEKAIIENFYEKAWKETKKTIRKDVFSVKPPKKEKKQKKDKKEKTEK